MLADPSLGTTMFILRGRLESRREDFLMRAVRQTTGAAIESIEQGDAATARWIGATQGEL